MMDLLYCIRYYLIRLVLYLTRAARRYRFKGLYDFTSKDPYKFGCLTNQQEFDAEWPLKDLSKKNDTVQIFLTSSSDQILAIHLSRRSDGRATVLIYIKTKNASYKREDICVDLSSDDTFSVQGLKLESVLPHKKWRISYNGILRNLSSGEDEHVRFVFTGNYINSLSDFTAYHDEHFIAHQLALSSCPIIPLSRINSNIQELDTVVQAFSFVGKVAVGDLQEEVYGFGHKKRTWEKQSSAVQSLGCLMAYTKNGIAAYLEESRIENFVDCISYGVMNFPSLQLRKLASGTLHVMKNPEKCASEFIMGTGDRSFQVQIVEEVDSLKFVHRFNDEECQRSVRIVKISFDGNVGHAVIIGGMGMTVKPELPEVSPNIIKYGQDLLQHPSKNVLQFTSRECMNSNVTGGKASSLAVLSNIAEKYGTFKVAGGIAVTTKAYEVFSNQKKVAEAIKILEEVIKGQPEIEDLKNACQRALDEIGEAHLPSEIWSDLESALKEVFGDYSSHKFAVRSSACGEDSEEMSAAGQMETFLGVRGIEDISLAVTKCWASQFSFVAVQYRRRYGQLLNCPMAVCVQEMVSSEVSGVMFTIDPVTANPKLITITANYGLGESVVSAAADPDTFTLQKTGNGVKEVARNIGAKKLRTVMLDDRGTEDVVVAEADPTTCLSDAQLNDLGRAALLVEKEYASPRDTEWAFSKGSLYMLQARPVTSVHNLDTSFEFLHESDQGVVSDLDCLSKANVGEVFGGSVSHLTVDSTFRSFMKEFKIILSNQPSQTVDDISHGREQFLLQQNSQCFFGTFSPMFDYTKDDLMSKGFAISMAGRIIDDEIVKVGAANKKKYVMGDGFPKPKPWEMIRDLWVAEKLLVLGEKYVEENKFGLEGCKTSKDMLFKILSDTSLQEKALDSHGKMIFYGTINNVIVLALLAHTEGDWNTNVYSDFAKMVASCKDLVSADVPMSLQKITHQVEEDFKDEFKTLSPQEALTKLTTPGTKSALLMKEFLKTHGHRCMHEFDLVSRTWSMDPIPVVKIIQTMMGGNEIKHKDDVTIDQILDGLHIKVNFFKRLLLKFFLKRVRKGIAFRERGKNTLIAASHHYRLLFRQLADRMVEEGRLQDPDLLFYLVPTEILLLLETRNPKIIIRAMNRMKNSHKAAKDIYPEHVAGLPFKPINTSAPVTARGDRKMIGTPVSQGSVVGPARVVISLDEAHLIERGDILITYATDIAWSPYFPLLSGIVTELGGLISHGAVVAREYGLPCVVGMHGATQMFRSGEQVLLDGTKGVLQTVADK